MKTEGLFSDAPTSPPATLSKKGIAELVGVTPGRVSQMISSGLPPEPNGRVDPAKAREWMRANIDPNRRRVAIDPAPDSAAAPTLSPFASTTPRGARDIAEAEISKLKAERLSGRLIDRRATLRAVEGRARMERDAWVSWVNRIAPLLAVETSADLSKVTACLDREVRAQLAFMAERPLVLK